MLLPIDVFVILLTLIIAVLIAWLGYWWMRKEQNVAIRVVTIIAMTAVMFIPALRGTIINFVLQQMGYPTIEPKTTWMEICVYGCVCASAVLIVVFQKGYVGSQENKTINQNHTGSGDNIAGNKYVQK
jgi:uncharacterized membrane protein YhfC